MSLSKDEAEIIKRRLASPECSMHEKQLMLDEVIGNLAFVFNDRFVTCSSYIFSLSNVVCEYL